jgi:hypothetical protein
MARLALEKGVIATHGVHLAVLWGFAVVQPLLADLGRHAEFFVARGNTSSDILLLAFGLALLPPLALLAVELLAGLVSPRLARWVHIGFVAVLFGAFAIGVFKRVIPATAPVLVATVAAAAAGAWAYLRHDVARSFLTMLAPAPAVFVAAFLLFSPAKELVFPSEAAAERSGLRSDTPVVVAIFDELPTISLMNSRRRIDAASFPGFGRLARTSTWYRNATTVGDGTHLAVPSIFSGRRPISKLPTARRYPESVFTMLGDRYDLHVLEPITRVCPDRLCDPQARVEPPTRRVRALISDLAIVEAHLLLPRGLAAGLPPIDRGFEDFGGQEDGVRAPRRRPPPTRMQGPDFGIAGDDLFAQRLRDGERFVRSVRAARARPPAYVAHFVVPHVPWRLLPSGRQYPVPGPSLPGSTDRVWSRDQFLVGQATQRHLLQVGYADRLLDRFIARLKRARVWDRALVIVAADHGIGLRPGGSRREINRRDFAGIAGVPLFVKRPNQRRPSIDDGAASTMDILPTIAEVLQSPDRPRFDGVPLVRRGRPRAVARRPPPVRSGRRDNPLSVGLAQFVRARDGELSRQRRLFPRSLRSVFSLGPTRELLGRPVAKLPVLLGARTVKVNEPAAFAHVDARSGVLPVYVTGYFDAAGDAGIPLAIAVNGRIRATARSYWVGEMARFSALISPGSLRRGRNLVEVFAVTPAGLERLGGAP